jgi:hypothetical protein
MGNNCCAQRENENEGDKSGLEEKGNRPIAKIAGDSYNAKLTTTESQ